MPLQPAYTWSETDTSIRITIDNVPIKDQSQLFCSDRVVKLNVPPYLLLLDLKHAVDDDRSAATITKGRKVVINLTKAEPGPWQKLVADGDASVIRKQREESVQRAHQKLLAAQQQRQARKQQEERAAVDLQIQQQKAQQDQLEALKQQELQQERQELQQWQQDLQQGDESDYEDDTADADADADAQIISPHDQQQSRADGSSEPAQCSSADQAYHGKGWWPSKAEQYKAATCNSSSITSTGTAEPECLTTTSSKETSLPCLAAAASPGDQAATACRSVLLDSNTAGISTSDEPFISASSTRRLAASTGASAGSSSATSSDAVLTAASNSSSSSSSSSSRRPSKPVAPVRSKAAPVQVTFTQLETPHLPAREQREVEIKQIKKAAGKFDSMDVADRQPAFLKDKGDAFAAQGNYMGAINAYSRALELDPKQAALWANRAAAHLALGQAEECVQDCNAAIGLVEQAHAALEVAPAAAKEIELQAGMLGAPVSSDVDAAAAAAAAGQSAAAGASAAEQRSSDADSATAQEASSSIHTSGSTTPAASDSSSSSTQAGVVGVQATQQWQQPAQPDGDTAAKLKQLLIKLLGRRAAGYVELQKLQEAAEDLQHALRLDPSNQGLKADVLEVSLALNPDSRSDAAVLRELAAARFKAGDFQGAAEAFTALAEVLKQQQQQQQQPEPHEQPQQELAQPGGAAQQQGIRNEQELQQQEQQLRLMLAGALSNRAACWLGLNMHEECVKDCWAAFEGLWPEDSAKAPTSQVGSAAAAADSSVASSPSSAESPVSSSSAGPDTIGHSHSSSSDKGSSADGSKVALLQQRTPDLLLQLTDKVCAQSAARTVGRMAAAYVCLKSVQAANAAFDWAAACWQLLGEHGRVASIQADKAKLQEVQGTAIN